MSSRQLLQPVDGNVSLTSAVLESAAKFAGVDVDEGVLPTAADLNALPIHGLVKKLASTSISTPQRPQQFSVPPEEDSGRTDSVGAMSSSTTLEQLIEASSPLIKAAKTPALTPWGYQLPSSTPARVSTGGSSSSSWQTVRAGLLSPPPALTAATILFSPPAHPAAATAPAADTDELGPREADDEAEPQQPPMAAVADAAEGATGPGGWLVDLVDWLSDAPPPPQPDGKKRLSSTETDTR